MDTGDLLKDIIGQLYNAAIDSCLWPDTLEALGRLLQCHYTVIAISATTCTSDLLANRSAVSAGDCVCITESANHPLPGCQPFPTGLRFRDPAPAVITGKGFCPHQLWWGRAADAENIPDGLNHALGVNLLDDDNLKAQMLFLRPLTAGLFNGAELILLNKLYYHLQRALRLYTRVQQLCRREKDLIETLNQLPFGVFLVDPQAKVLLSNATAARHPSMGKGLLDLAQKELSLLIQGEPRGLGSAIRKAAAKPLSRAQLLTVDCPQTRIPLSLTVVPLGRDSNIPQATGAVVAIFVRSLEKNNHLTPTQLEQLFGLTRAEARLAASLVEGYPLKKAAQYLNISEGTARQYLKHIFAKTGCHRQGELIHLLLSQHNPT